MDNYNKKFKICDLTTNIKIKNMWINRSKLISKEINKNFYSYPRLLITIIFNLNFKKKDNNYNKVWISHFVKSKKGTFAKRYEDDFQNYNLQVLLLLLLNHQDVLLEIFLPRHWNRKG